MLTFESQVKLGFCEDGLQIFRLGSNTSLDCTRIGWDCRHTGKIQTGEALILGSNWTVYVDDTWVMRTNYI